MSLSTFKGDRNQVMRQMKKTKEPIVLTVNGKSFSSQMPSWTSSHPLNGVVECGEKARLWVAQLLRAIAKHLTSLPLACPTRYLGSSITGLLGEIGA